MEQRWHRHLVAAGATAAIWMALTWLGDFTTANAAGFAALYLPIGLTVGLLWRLPAYRWAIAAGAFIGAVMLVPFADSTWVRGILNGGANTAEALVTAAILHRFGNRLRRPADAAAFLIAAVSGAAAGALLGAANAWALSSHDPLETAVTWFASDLVGIMVVAPPVFLIDREDMRWRKAVPSVILLAFATYCTVLAARFSLGGGLWWMAVVWFPVLGAVLLIGLRFGASLLGFVQLPAVIAGFAALGAAPELDLLGGQATAVLLTFSMQWAVLAVGQMLVQRDLAAGLAAVHFTETPLPTALIKHSPDGWAIVDANPAFADIAGITPERLRGSDVRALFALDDLPIWESAISAADERFRCDVTIVGPITLRCAMTGTQVRAEHGGHLHARWVLHVRPLTADAAPTIAP